MGTTVKEKTNTVVTFVEKFTHKITQTINLKWYKLMLRTTKIFSIFVQKTFKQHGDAWVLRTYSKKYLPNTPLWDTLSTYTFTDPSFVVESFKQRKTNDGPALAAELLFHLLLWSENLASLKRQSGLIVFAGAELQNMKTYWSAFGNYIFVENDSTPNSVVESIDLFLRHLQFPRYLHSLPPEIKEIVLTPAISLLESENLDLKDLPESFKLELLGIN